VLGGDADVSGPFVQVGTRRVEPVMVAEPHRKILDGAQPGEWAVDLADRDRAAERGNRIAGELEEFVVPGENLRSVGFSGGAGVVVQLGDGAPDLVLAAPVASQGCLQDAHAFGDLGFVPSCASLLVEGDECAVLVGARGAAGMVQQHQRQQPGGLGLVARERQLPGEAGSLRRTGRPGRNSPQMGICYEG
jgi:hypothetical protein